MELAAWLNVISPDGPCWEPSTLPIPGSPVSLAMIDAAAERLVARRGPAAPFRLLEVGSLVGISAITWGRGLERCGVTDYTIVCVDLWDHCGDVVYGADALVVAARRNVVNRQIFDFNVAKSIGFAHVVPILGDSRVVLPQLAPDFFDAVYVDGFHGEAVVRSDLAEAWRVCRPGGIVCGDDYDMSPALLATMPPEAFALDGYADAHPGVVRAVDAVLGRPKPYGSFWAFEKFAEEAVPLDVAAWPRRIPAHVPPHYHAHFAAWFAGPRGFPLGHPMNGADAPAE